MQSSEFQNSDYKWVKNAFENRGILKKPVFPLLNANSAETMKDK